MFGKKVSNGFEILLQGELCYVCLWSDVKRNCHLSETFKQRENKFMVAVVVICKFGLLLIFIKGSKEFFFGHLARNT